VFQDFSLVNGTWDVCAADGQLQRVRPQDISSTALLSVEGELDDISGSGQTEAVHALCSGVPKSMHKHVEAKGAGHYGIFSGRRWRELVYPEVKAFIRKNALAKQPTEPNRTKTAPAAATRETPTKPARARPLHQA
jgi:poly(3-hydroxybutyrate) depolymerase